MMDREPSTASALAIAAVAIAAACGGGDESSSGGGKGEAEARIPARQSADMLYSIIEADRAVYTERVVDRLTGDEGIHYVDPETSESRAFVASERWESEPAALPLPSQMFKMASEKVAEGEHGLHYALLSEWPISDKNAARTQVEKEGLTAVREERKPYYGTESLGGERYFTAVYPDVAVAPACVDCHNAHSDSPRDDFEVGDVMGGVVIRLALE